MIKSLIIGLVFVLSFSILSMGCQDEDLTIEERAEKADVDNEVVDKLEERVVEIYNLENEVRDPDVIPDSSDEEVKQKIYEIFRSGWDNRSAVWLTERLWNEDEGVKRDKDSHFGEVENFMVLEKDSNRAVAAFEEIFSNNNNDNGNSNKRKSETVKVTLINEDDDNWIIIKHEYIDEDEDEKEN